jgi:hypothetical protein
MFLRRGPGSPPPCACTVEPPAFSPLPSRNVTCSNNSVTDFFSLPPAERCARILVGARQVVGGYGFRGAMTWALFDWIIRRFNRAARRIEALAAQLAAGTLRLRASPRRTPRRGTAPPPPPAAPTAPPPPWRHLPHRPAWLLRMVRDAEHIRCNLAAHRSQLEHLLNQPDMAELIRAAPPIGRELRPICRMLGVQPPPGLLPPPRRRPPRPRQAAPDQPGSRQPPRRKLPRLKPLPRTMDGYGPPSRPGHERPVRFLVPPRRPATPAKPA